MIFLDDWIHPRVVETMGVPTALGGALSADISGEVNCDEFCSRFHEPPRQETALSISMAAGGMPPFGRRGGKIERLAQFLGMQHRERFVVIFIQPSRRGRDIEQARLLVN